MASSGAEILGDHYGKDHLSYERIEGLGLTVMTENGETGPPEELGDGISRIVDRDERLRGEKCGDHGGGHDPLSPSSVLLVDAVGGDPAGDGGCASVER